MGDLKVKSITVLEKVLDRIEEQVGIDAEQLGKLTDVALKILDIIDRT